VLSHVAKKRALDAPRTDFFAHSEAFAVLVKFEYVGIDGAPLSPHHLLLLLLLLLLLPPAAVCMTPAPATSQRLRWLVCPRHQCGELMHPAAVAAQRDPSCSSTVLHLC
jgi:hypothetical protein